MKWLAALKPSVTADGGYADVMVAEARGIASVPDELASVEAASLLCAGITTYNALRKAGLRGGDLVSLRGTWDSDLRSLTGTPIEAEDTLAFSVLENTRPMIETVPLEQAANAYARMMQGKARFRMVLVTPEGVAQGAQNASGSQ